MTCTAVADVSLYKYNIPNDVFESPSTSYLIMQDDVT